MYEQIVGGCSVMEVPDFVDHIPRQFKNVSFDYFFFNVDVFVKFLCH